MGEEGVPPENALMEEEDDEAWRKGEGGSCPAYRAIFLATVSLGGWVFCQRAAGREADKI